jgi:succinate-acetate transporter protein
MTPKEVNEWKSRIILFIPMYIIILIFALNGFCNLGILCLGGVVGILCGFIGMLTGIIK